MRNTSPGSDRYTTEPIICQGACQSRKNKRCQGRRPDFSTHKLFVFAVSQCTSRLLFVKGLKYGLLTYFPPSPVAGTAWSKHDLLVRQGPHKRHDAISSKRPSVNGDSVSPGAWCGNTRDGSPVGQCVRPWSVGRAGDPAGSRRLAIDVLLKTSRCSEPPGGR